MIKIEVINIKNKTVTIKIRKFDVEIANELRLTAKKLIDKGIFHFIVDLSETPYIDCTALGILIMINRICKESYYGKGITLKNVQFQVMNVIKATRMDKVLKIIND